MKITGFSVKGLFGSFNHEIKLNEMPAITMILGDNGLGKTILMKMLSNVFNGKLSYLNEIKFSSFHISFENGYLNFDKKHTEKVDDIVVTCNYRNKKHRTTFSQMDINPQTTFFNNKIYIHKFLSDLYNNQGKVESYDVMKKNRLRFADVEQEKYQQWLKELLDDFDVHYVSSDRLFVLDDDVEKKNFDVLPRTIQKYADELFDKVKTVMADASSYAREVDRSFPGRIIKMFSQKNENDRSSSNKKLTNELIQMKEKVNLLEAAGLYAKDLDYFPTYEIDLNPQILRALSVYMEDCLAKLAKYESIAKRIKLFTEILNGKLLFKTIAYDQERGLVVRAKNGDKIDLINLSSGEQHLFILFYELLFKYPQNVVLLVDEPEISLHVRWQKDFVDDLKNVLGLNPMTVIMATHSPTLIGNYWELTRELSYDEK